MKNKAAQALGSIKSAAKTKAARSNGAKGGRPSIDIEPMLSAIEEDGPLSEAPHYRAAFPSEWRKARRLNRLNTWRDDTGTEFVEVREQQ